MMILCHSVKIEGEAKIDSKKVAFFQVFLCAGNDVFFKYFFLK